MSKVVDFVNEQTIHDYRAILDALEEAVMMHLSDHNWEVDLPTPRNLALKHDNSLTLSYHSDHGFRIRNGDTGRDTGYQNEHDLDAIIDRWKSEDAKSREQAIKGVLREIR